jgi:hypothetical protein
MFRFLKCLLVGHKVDEQSSSVRSYRVGNRQVIQRWHPCLHCDLLVKPAD